MESMQNITTLLVGIAVLYGIYRLVDTSCLGQAVAFGFMLYAALLSWREYHSVFLAIVHGVLGIFYVGYYYFIR